MTIREITATLAILALAAMLSCASGGRSEPPGRNALVQAAALSYLFDHNDSALGASAGSYCVGVGSGLIRSDPSPSLLRVLQPKFVDVTPLSNCATAAAPGGGWRVIDTLSREPSVAWFVEGPAFDGEDQARLYAEYVETSSRSTGYDCRLSRGAEGWSVERCTPGIPR